MSAGAEAPTAVDAGFSGAIGLARREITPPLDVTTRSWGPSVNRFSAGVHRPLTLTAVAFAAGGQGPLVLVAADLGWWRTPEDERHIRQGILEELGAGDERVLVHLSHTHAGPRHRSRTATAPALRISARCGRPPRRLHARRSSAPSRRRSPARPAGARWPRTATSLHAGRYVVGFNPAAAADDTLLVGRIAATGGRLLGVLYNYACHPTTLAWQNTLVSPDFVGAAREVIESATDGAFCAFLQGASGELAPRHQYVGDTGGRRSPRPLARPRRAGGARGAAATRLVARLRRDRRVGRHARHVGPRAVPPAGGARRRAARRRAGAQGPADGRGARPPLGGHRPEQPRRAAPPRPGRPRRLRRRADAPVPRLGLAARDVRRRRATPARRTRTSRSSCADATPGWRSSS